MNKISHGLFTNTSFAIRKKYFSKSVALFNYIPKLIPDPDEKIPLRYKYIDTEVDVKRPYFVKKKKAYRDSFLQILFQGNLDQDSLLYPEIEEGQSIFYEWDGHDQNITSILSLPIQAEYGGCNLPISNFAQVMEEISRNSSFGATIANYHSATQTMSRIRDETIRSECQTGIANGKYCPAIALNEENLKNLDLANLQTKATILRDPTNSTNIIGYKLIGKKSWVFNGPSSNLFLTFALLCEPKEGVADESNKPKLGAFLIDITDTESNSSTILKSKPYDKLGLNNFQICDVIFNNLPIQPQYLIAQDDEAIQLAQTAISNERFNHSLLYTGLLKNFTNNLIDKSNYETMFDRRISEYPTFQETLGHASVYIYAMESLVYLVASLRDDYHHYNSILEDSVLRLFTAKYSKLILDDMYNLTGREAIQTSNVLTQSHMDLAMLDRLDGSLSYLKIETGIRGMQSALLLRPGLQERSHKIRRYLYHPELFPMLKNNYSWIKFLSLDSIFTVTPDKTAMRDYVHPNLAATAKDLEYLVCQFNSMVERVLGKYGMTLNYICGNELTSLLLYSLFSNPKTKELTHQHSALCVLVDYLVELFALIAVIGRASRSICLGLKNSDYEFMAAKSLCSIMKGKMDFLMTQLFEITLFFDNYEYNKRIGQLHLKHEEYSFSHPLIKNL